MARRPHRGGLDEWTQASWLGCRRGCDGARHDDDGRKLPWRRNRKGGFVKPCSLDGVNPVYHPDIFGNPAVARSFGFVLSRDGAWHVIPNCNIR